MKLKPETDLSFTRTLNAPRSVLWECWTTPTHIMNFFMPKPHSLDACEIDLRVGGKFNTTMNIDGKQIENKGVYLEVIDGRRLVFTDTYSEGWAPAPDPFMTAIVEFADNGSGGTTYTAIARHRSPEARQTHEDMGFFDGWGTVATQLEEYARSLANG
ncbi:SRPBCC family protein [Qingshengfaniella alkalisoli]|uniref:Polyketide cyclase n=1 Tax=Qingshengfaniella alkalisoli TaxID=2599296 RepID=A0A5B8IX14_9RHOB|nr:SRPBCC family protein [Qingshengfaniella alkalisoli]QDY70682.1 polyketide cyclase [Qingshengfaniella alkalisoli]